MFRTLYNLLEKDLLYIIDSINSEMYIRNHISLTKKNLLYL